MYYFSTKVELPIDKAVDKLRETLQAHKLGIVSDVNVQAIFKAKLGEESPGYRILGACAPKLAKRVIDAEAEGGTLLPCTVVVREADGYTMIDFMDPEVVLGLANNAEIDETARNAKVMLQQVRDELSKNYGG